MEIRACRLMRIGTKSKNNRRDNDLLLEDENDSHIYDYKNRLSCKVHVCIHQYVP